MPRTKEIVHQTKELKGRDLTTKCGVTGHVDKIPHSSWFSDITCEQCLA